MGIGLMANLSIPKSTKKFFLPLFSMQNAKILGHIIYVYHLNLLYLL